MKGERVDRRLLLPQLHIFLTFQGEIESQYHMMSSKGNGSMDQDLPKIPRHLPSSFLKSKGFSWHPLVGDEKK